MVGRNLFLLNLLLLLVVISRARGFGVFGSSRRYGGTHRPGWAWTSGAIGHRHQINGHQIMMQDCNGNYLCVRAKTHYIMMMSLGSTVFRPHYRRNYGGKKGIFNFFGVSSNTVDNPPTSPDNDGVDGGLISARRSDSSELPAGWSEDWEALVPNLVQSTPSQKLTVQWPNRVTAEAGNVIEVISNLITGYWKSGFAIAFDVKLGWRHEREANALMAS